jgi:hypothetical protein
MNIGAAKKQVFQSIAAEFPFNALLHKWGMVSSAACALWGSSRDTEPHPASLPWDASIRAHHNLAQRLWKGISLCLHLCGADS